MINSFKGKKTKQLYDGERVPEFEAFARQAEKRLRVLDAADTLLALRSILCHINRYILERYYSMN